MPPEDDNETIKQMRKALDEKDNDLKKLKDEADKLVLAKQKSDNDLKDLNDRLKNIELKDATELEKANAKIQELETTLNTSVGQVTQLTNVKEYNDKINSHLTSQYDKTLGSLDKTIQEQVKTLSYIEGDPLGSIEKLTSALTILGVKVEGGIVSGTITLPPGSPPPGQTPPPTKLDPKTITLFSPGVFRTAEQLKAQMVQTPK